MTTADPLVRRHVYHDNSGICHICGEFVSFADMHIDHVVPSSLGGADDLDNLRPSHAQCNRQKGSRYEGISPTPQDVRGIRERLRLTQVEFAELIGVAAITVSFWENGRRRPTGLYARAVRSLLDKHPPDTEPTPDAG